MKLYWHPAMQVMYKAVLVFVSLCMPFLSISSVLLLIKKYQNRNLPKLPPAAGNYNRQRKNNNITTLTQALLGSIVSCKNCHSNYPNRSSCYSSKWYNFCHQCINNLCCTFFDYSISVLRF
jgi:hypothetical protein